MTTSTTSPARCPHCFGDHDGCTPSTPRCSASKDSRQHELVVILGEWRDAARSRVRNYEAMRTLAKRFKEARDRAGLVRVLVTTGGVDFDVVRLHSTHGCAYVAPMHGVESLMHDDLIDGRVVGFQAHEVRS